MATSSEPYVAPVVTSPVDLHLVDGSAELGAEVTRLARKHDMPLTFNLLRMTPVEALRKLAHRGAKVVLAKG